MIRATAVPRSVTVMAPSFSLRLTHSPVFSCSSRIEIDFMCHIVSHPLPASKRPSWHPHAVLARRYAMSETAWQVRGMSPRTTIGRFNAKECNCIRAQIYGEYQVLVNNIIRAALSIRASVNEGFGENQAPQTSVLTVAIVDAE